MKTIDPALAGGAAVILMVLAVLRATHNQLGRWQELPFWFWAVLLLIGAELLLVTWWLSPGRNQRRSLRRYGAAQGGHFAVFWFLLTLTGSALEPQVAWGDALLTGLLGGLLFGLVMTALYRNALLSASHKETP